MRLFPAVSLAVTLARAAATAAAQDAPAHAPPPPPSGYYGDYGAPVRYVLALSGRGSSWIAAGRSRHRTSAL